MPGVLVPLCPCTCCFFYLECSASEIYRTCALLHSGLYSDIIFSVRPSLDIPSELHLYPIPPTNSLTSFPTYLFILFIVYLIHPLKCKLCEDRDFVLFCSVQYSVPSTVPGTERVLNKYVNERTSPFYLDYLFCFLFLPDPTNTNPIYFSY